MHNKMGEGGGSAQAEPTKIGPSGHYLFQESWGFLDRCDTSISDALAPYSLPKMRAAQSRRGGRGAFTLSGVRTRDVSTGTRTRARGGNRCSARLVFDAVRTVVLGRGRAACYSTINAVCPRVGYGGSWSPSGTVSSGLRPPHTHCHWARAWALRPPSRAHAVARAHAPAPATGGRRQSRGSGCGDVQQRTRRGGGGGGAGLSPPPGEGRRRRPASRRCRGPARSSSGASGGCWGAAAAAWL